MNKQQAAVIRQVTQPDPDVIPTIVQIRQVLACLGTNAEESQTRTIISLVTTTDLQLGELCKVRWSDVDFDQRTISVDSIKGGNGRLVPLASMVLELLESERDQVTSPEHILGGHPKRAVARASRRLEELSSAHCAISFNINSLRHWFCAQSMDLGGDFESICKGAGYSFPSSSTFIRYFPISQEKALKIAAQHQAMIENKLFKSAAADLSEVSA